MLEKMRDFVEHWYLVFDSYRMILYCDLKYWREEGIYRSLCHEDDLPVMVDWRNHDHHSSK